MSFRTNGKSRGEAFPGFDAVGRRIAQTREDGIQESYTYDATNQLTGIVLWRGQE